MRIFNKNMMLLCVTGMLSSCNFLAFDEATGKDEKETYISYEKLKGFLIPCYNGLQADFGTVGGALREAATDNAIYTNDASSVYDMYFNKWSATNAVDDKFSSLYKSIYHCNYYLENIDPEMINMYEWDANYDKFITELNLHVYEARALRAYFHFELAKRYGDVPLVTRVLTDQEANSIKKTSFKEMISFVVEECDTVMKYLPVTYKGYFDSQTGRVTKGFAMALKSRALLYAASPLHNTTAEVSQWEEAAKASYDLIQSGYYSLQPLTVDPLFTREGNDILNSTQLIFERRNGNTNTFEKANLPAGFHPEVVGTGGNTPTENLASCYEMKDGTSFDLTLHQNQVYFDAQGLPSRDPRFYLNILPDQGRYGTYEVQTYVGGKNNNISLPGSTLSGYYLHKYLAPSLVLDAGLETKLPHHFVLFRYAEVLLNYAEAMFELTSSATATTASCPLSAFEAIQLVRNAAGMPTDVAKVNLQYIRDERRRELAFEDHRFWDIRRWKQGELVKDIKGMHISVDPATGTKTYRIKTIQKRQWSDKMYFYPFSQKETYVNANLVQNPGW